MTQHGRIEDRKNAARYFKGGRALFTLVSGRTGTRFTYRIDQGKGPASHLLFVSLLRGPENTTDFLPFGTVFPDVKLSLGRFGLNKKSKLGLDAPSVKALRWLHGTALNDDEAFAKCEFWHHGRCSLCNRVLTDPQSIARGIGPKCASKE